MLPLEVACVWSKPLSKVNSLYFILKYMPALHLPSLLLQGVALSIPMEMCQPLFIANSVIIPFSISCCQAVLFLRIHVLGQSKPLTIYLVAHYIISNFAIFALSAKFYTTVEAAPFRPRERFGCTSLIADGNFTSIIYAIILFNELVMAFLTLFLAYRKYMASSSTPIMRIFRRDGTFYFITLAVISTANILVNRLHPDPEYSILLAVIQYTLHNVFTTRMILHLRMTTRQSEHPEHYSSREWVRNHGRPVPPSRDPRAYTANICLSTMKPR
ncbi:hypothetical protein CC2G_009365 [Coprinopsis cinerea AmutBmut pab1-1]|nr:hypothetical protein CC2G_009365 [Coprinopsis cinerea AmutBmut pab1-1]